MNEVMLSKWNNKINKNDQVYILGDFAFGDSDSVYKLLNKLNGNKFLIKGNHDYFIKHKQIANQFAWIKDYYRLKYNKLKIILFHYPIMTWDCKHYNSIHLYGHIHNNKLEHEQKNSYNVGVDVNNFEPVSLEEILEKINYIKQ